MLIRYMLVACSFGLTSFLAQAQRTDPTRLGDSTSRQNSPILRQELSTGNLPLEEENNFAPTSPGDSDLGQQLILKETPKERWLRATLDAFGYWTDNAANASVGEEEDSYWGGRISLGAQPKLTNKLFLDVDASQEMYRYDEFDGLDFENLDASVGLLYVEPKLWNSIFFIQGQYNRVTNDDFSNELVNSWSLRAGLQKTFLIDRRNSVHASVMGDWDLQNSVDQLNRHEYVADLGYKFKLMRDLAVSISYRFTLFDYQDVDRTDYLHLIGTSVTWSPYESVDVYATANFSNNNSTADSFDYEAVNVGGGIGVRLRF